MSNDSFLRRGKGLQREHEAAIIQLALAYAAGVADPCSDAVLNKSSSLSSDNSKPGHPFNKYLNPEKAAIQHDGLLLVHRMEKLVADVLKALGSPEVYLSNFALTSGTSDATTAAQSAILDSAV
jgi:hypothetical protein